jgi:hypothetical protein
MAEHEHTQQPAPQTKQAPPPEEWRSLSAALAQTAQDLKEVGLGALGTYAYEQWKRPKDPPASGGSSSGD